jgi:hypothetical protein
MAPEEPNVYGNKRKVSELRRSGIKVGNQVPLRRSSSPFVFVTINIGYSGAKEMATITDWVLRSKSSPLPQPQPFQNALRGAAGLTR